MLFQFGINTHVCAVMHWPLEIPSRKEPNDAFLFGELVNHLLGFVRLVHGQIDHGYEAIVFFKNALAQPTVIGAGHCHLDLDLGVRCQQQHWGWEKARHIRTHRVHPAPCQSDVAVWFFGDNFLVPTRIARHAPSHVLRTDRLRNKAGAANVTG